MSLYHCVSIGNVSLDGNIFLAPLAGYTDKVYRSICLSHGASLAYTEMVSSEGIYRKSLKTVQLMERGEGEKNLAVQLFMPNAETAGRSVEGTLAYNPQIIDINCGCPVPKVTKTGAGSSLLKNPAEIGNIVKVLVSETNLPVTVKIRTGWDNDSINYLETAEKAFDAGASAVCMHARTKTQLYMPYAQWDKLKDLKDHFKDKVIIGSGDLFTPYDAKRMLEETGVDALVFARGAIGNPFIFEQTKRILSNQEEREISIEERRNAIMEHLKGSADMLGETVACREMRKHVSGYIKGVHNGSKIRNQLCQAVTIEQYADALALLFV